MTYLLHHILTESARRYPGNEALRYQSQALTYAQLDSITDQLARALQCAGVARGDRVGIYVHKSFASVISIFGVLKAGAVYVPLDPNSPAKRLAYITRNCDIKVLLTTSGKRDAVAQLVAEDTPLQHIILADSDDFEILNLKFKISKPPSAAHRPPSTVHRPLTIETDLAYILYTSGSTGDPKGVMISHRTIFTFINWCADTFALTEHDRVTSHAPIHFDLSTFDLFVTLKAGATVVLLPEKLSIFPIQLVRLLQDERITVTYLVPSILSMMVSYGKLDSHDLSALRLVLFAGEVFPLKFLRQLVQALPHADFYNLYGPTETNVCTYYKVQPRDLAPGCTQPVPIGNACENTEVFAVDEEGRLVQEPGREGELWVRGSCLAYGYWGDPQRTARSFVRNPFQPHFHDLAYRTGDIVTLDDGQNWRFVGRRDHMVKSRGYRIELGEIEAALYGHSDVKEAAVVPIPDDLIGNQIKALVVPHEGSQLTVAAIKTHCSRRLPSYMVPTSFELRDELPKTSTGKIDRRKLF